MGSKKHKKHHKTDKWENPLQEGPSSGSNDKPLKLVLKVSNVHSPSGQQAPSPAPPISSNDLNDFGEDSKHSKKAKKKKKKKTSDKKHKHHHHHHHKEHDSKKDKRKHDDLDDLDLEPPPAKMPAIEEHRPPGLRTLDPRSCTLRTGRRVPIKTPLQLTLTYLLNNIQKKDVQQFFAWPVSDVIAPGYSSIISHPMDLSTIKKKIDNYEYSNILEFKNDVKLMCDNACIYNRPDTIYFKAAKKLWHFSSRLLSKEQLMSLKRNLPCMENLTMEEMGLELPECLDTIASHGTEEDRKFKSGGQVLEALQGVDGEESHGGDKDNDEENAEEILTQVRQAAQEAANRLAKKKPGSTLGFLRQDTSSGSTTLAILHPSSAPSTEHRVNLEMVTGRLAQGSANIVGFKEDPKNLAKPVSYLNYGPFSSFAPYYDSMFSNLTKEESDLILSTYGDEVGVQYAESILNFANGCDYVIDMVDNLLNVLTNGEHEKTTGYLIERKQMREEEEKIRKLMSDKQETTDPFQDIDLSMLEPNKEKEEVELTQRQSELQEQLEEAGTMLAELAQMQNKRLSAEPPPHLANVSGAGENEIDLANKVCKKLANISSEVPPNSIVTIEGIRKALGITCQQPLETTAKPIVSSSSPHESQFHASSDYDLNEFLETGPMLRVCDSPTASSSYGN